jgi:hypothetical protein
MPKERILNRNLLQRPYLVCPGRERTALAIDWGVFREVAENPPSTLPDELTHAVAGKCFHGCVVGWFLARHKGGL